MKNSSVIAWLATLLTVLFVALKLAKVISWNWVWVLAPFWGYCGLIVFIAIIVLIIRKGE